MPMAPMPAAALRMDFSTECPQGQRDGAGPARREVVEFAPNTNERRLKKTSRNALQQFTEQKRQDDVKTTICDPFRKLDRFRREARQFVQKNDSGSRTFPEKRECAILGRECLLAKAFDGAHELFLPSW